METSVIENGSSAEIKVTGRIDTRTAKEASEVFLAAGETHEHITLDMGEATYISSAGIRVLRDLYMAIYRKGGTLKMTRVPESVMKVLEMTGLTGLMEIRQDD